MKKVETPITDHLRNYAPNLEKYKAEQNFFLSRKIENKNDYKFKNKNKNCKFISCIESIMDS